MRTRSTQDDKLFAAQSQATFLRIDVQDTGGTWRDLTARRNYNFVTSARLTSNPDQPAASLDASLRREIYNLSVAPLVAGSVLNTLGGGTQLVRLNANLRAYVQVRPAGLQPDNTGHSGDDGNAGKWTLIFDGQIDAHDSGPDPLTINASDLVSRLQRAWIKTERIYGMWQGSRRVLQNTVVVATPAATNGANNLDAPAGPWWQAQGTFTTGSTEPSWPASPTPGTTTVSDNGGTWKCVAGPTGTPLEVHIQQLLDDNLGAGTWSLFTPSASSEVIRPYTQSGMSVFQAIQNTADIIGWLVRWKWDNGTSQFRLTFFDPGRTNTTSAYTIGKSFYKPIASFKQDLTNVRNDVDVRYFDAGTLDSSGNPTPATVNSQDASSITSYGDLYAAIAEGAAAGINTATTAQKLADAVRQDLAQPPVTTQVEINAAWWFEPTDVITLSANGLQFDADQLLAVFGLEMNISGKDASTILSLRGKPCSGHTRWAGKFAAGGLNGGPVKLINPHTPLKVQTVQTVAGAKINFAIPSSKQNRYDVTELHISTSNGFTPSSSTLKATSKNGMFVVSDLTPGTTYYHRLIHKDVRGIASAASAQQSFVAGYVKLGMAGVAPVNAIDPALTQQGQAHNVSTAAYTSGAAIPFDTIDLDTIFTSTGGAQRFFTNPIDGTFAAQSTGWFLINASCLIGGVNPGDVAQLRIEHFDSGLGSWRVDHIGPTSNSFTDPNVSQDYISTNISFAVQMAAGVKYRVTIINAPEGGGFPSWSAYNAVVQIIQILA
jgi:hypothetical protein